jgi:hypothetical protein
MVSLGARRQLRGLRPVLLEIQFELRVSGCEWAPWPNMDTLKLGRGSLSIMAATEAS